ncbi:hypothetical protein [Neobacillus kokaensis]|uniref:Lipoprotein n=1 Tax=Neobacillus kokaensis TaxID=2759023 RepID=A0ABQ3NAE6_9BACI|nr:hypothetical protein [Neobacillus kokaensis]GHI00301.1 hypothetical protein AM1BK_38430 [Neobacillus kokaensis]
MLKSSLLLIFTFIISIGLIGCQSTSSNVETQNSPDEKAIQNEKMALADGDYKKTKNNISQEAITKQEGAKKQKETSGQEKNGAFTYKTYSNPKAGFSVEYPATFFRSPAPTYNDGREFYNEDCTIIASGIYIKVKDKKAIAAYYNRALEHVTSSIAYKRLGHDWYVISYKEGSNTVYQKAIINKGTISTLKITYPSSKQKYYEPMINRISSTFKG